MQSILNGYPYRRAERARNASRTGAGPAGGVPGVPANTPPPQAQLVDGAPNPAPPAAATSTDTETATDRSYELGREVAVTSTRPGGLTKLSVAVAVSDEALKKAAPMTAAVDTLSIALIGNPDYFGAGPLVMILAPAAPRAFFGKRVARAGNHPPTAFGKPLHRRMADSTARPRQQHHLPFIRHFRLLGLPHRLGPPYAPRSQAQDRSHAPLGTQAACP